MNLNWNQVQDDVQNLIEDSAPNKHLLKAIKFSSIKKEKNYITINLSVQNKLTLQMCQRKIVPLIKSASEAKLGYPVVFAFSIVSSQEPFIIVEEEPPTFIEDEKPASTEYIEEKKTQPAIFTFKNKYVLNPRYNFDNYFRTDENALAKVTVEHFSSFENIQFNFMLITGPSGTGKTHLLNSLGWQLLKNNTSLKIKLISGDDLISDFQSALVKKNMNDFRLKYRLQTDVLLIDDIHCLERAKATQTELFNLLNEFQAMGKKIILTCEKPIKNMEFTDERLKSRLFGCLKVELEYPSLTSKKLILDYKLKQVSMELSPLIVERILLNSGPCIRSLEGALNRLQMLLQTNGNLNITAINKMFPPVSEKEIQTITVDGILLKVCTKGNLSIKELLGPCRKQNFVKARRECAYILKNQLNKSVAEIGRILQRDHSTVLSLIKSANKEAILNTSSGSL